ncbi:MAG TPA: glycosyltransferase [Candidatus Didemnitutus sp.]|nr:glycosyltransferase [Candidatus Didemnitutus sp.]
MSCPPSKVVVILSRFPYPLEKGDKLRAFQHLKNLAASGHEVHVIALSDVTVLPQHREMVRPFCTSITVLPLSFGARVMNLLRSFVRGLPLQVGYFLSPQAQKRVNELLDSLKPDVVYCQLIRTATYFQASASKVPSIIDYQDAFSRGTEQRIASAPWLLRPLYRRELRKVQDYESRSYAWFNEHIIISEQDRSVMFGGGGQDVTILPNGIDTTFFAPRAEARTQDVTFVGNMNYPPNVDAAVFLVRTIMPIVWRLMPDTRVVIAGASPHRTVRALASERVEVTGWVDDIRSRYATTRVFVAPMRIGTGLQNKLLEAMAMRIACVTTPISHEPLGAQSGRDIRVGHTAEELAAHIVELLADEAERDRLAMAGYNFVVTTYAMEHTRQVLNNVLAKALMRGREQEPVR